MTEKRIREILDGVAAGRMTATAAFKHIRELPFEDLACRRSHALGPRQ